MSAVRMWITVSIYDTLLNVAYAWAIVESHSHIPSKRTSPKAEWQVSVVYMLLPSISQSLTPRNNIKEPWRTRWNIVIWLQATCMTTFITLPLVSCSQFSPAWHFRDVCRVSRFESDSCNFSYRLPLKFNQWELLKHSYVRCWLLTPVVSHITTGRHKYCHMT